MKKTITAILIFFHLLIVQSNSQNTFNKVFLFEEYGMVFSNVLVTDSCYYVTGLSIPEYNPFAIGSVFVKFDLNGEPLLHTIKLDTQIRNIVFWNPTLQQISNDEFAILGYTNDTNSIRRAALLKYSIDGEVISINEYTNGFDSTHFYRAADLEVYPNGDFLLINHGDSGADRSDFEIIRTDSLGNEIWRRTFGDNWSDVALSGLQRTNGNVIIGGWRSNVGMVEKYFKVMNYLIEIDTAGQLVWDYLSPITELYGGVYDMIETEDGGLICTSAILEEECINGVNGTLRDEPYIFKLNANHEVEWSHTIWDERSSIGEYTARVIRATDNENYVFVGNIHDLNWTPENQKKGWIGKFTPDGDSLWVRFYSYRPDSTGHTNYLYDIKAVPDGGYIMVGQSYVYDTTTLEPYDFDQQGWLLKVDEYGCLVPGCHLVDNVIEIDDIQFELKLYPNPVSDFLNVFFRNHSSKKDFTFSIVDLSGREIRSFKNTDRETTLMIPVWDYPSGVYFLQVRSKNHILKTEKIIIAK